METCVVIMAGGKGSRFWPLSRTDMPKQFLKIIDNEKTMIQLTVERALKITDVSNIIIVTSYQYKKLISQQLPDIPDENILYEPEQKNTAPCIAYACAKIRSKYEDAVMVVLSADHLIKHTDIFTDTIQIAVNNSKENHCLTTIGIVPNSPETGYGYIKYLHEPSSNEQFVYRVDSFVEKPDLSTAKKYISSGKYLWNSGIFVWKVSSIVENYKCFLPKTYAAYKELIKYFLHQSSEPLADIYSSMDAISIDYGILEKCRDVFTVLGNFGWDDVGSWLAIERIKETDNNCNYFSGDVIAYKTGNTTVITKDKPVATVGIKDLVVVNTDDVILICSKDNAQNISKLTDNLSNTKYERLL